MAKGGNGKAQAKGHENANENFANGMCENGAPNENAAKGLENALSHNPFECSGTVIDFDSGVNTVTYDYGYYVGGTYSQDGFSLDYYSYDYFGYSDLADPIHDANGDGDNEFGLNQDTSTYYYWADSYFSMTADDGSSFSLDSFELEYVDDGTDYYYDFAQFYTYEETEEGSNVWEQNYAYTYDGEYWYTQVNTYDYNTYDYDYQSGSTYDIEEVLALFDDQAELSFYASGDFSVDNIEVSELMVA